jgi:hypothetical protein
VPEGLPFRPTLCQDCSWGGIAFALLIMGELGVSVFVFGRSWEATLAVFRSPPGMIGLSAQAAFALFPLVQAMLRRTR